MTLSTLLDLAVLVFQKAARPECHSVIQSYPGPDLAGFSHHHAGAVIDKEMRADLCARMNVDPSARVRPFTHESWNQRNLSFVKQVRHSLDCDRFDRRVGDDHFLVTGRG